MNALYLALLFALSSCSLFTPRESLTTKKTIELVHSVPIVGEGRGRLTVEQKQNVFSFDALLREDRDWVFAATIPLHGEEAMILPAIREDALQESALQSDFELRLIHVLKSKKEWRISPLEFKRRLRSLVRFLLAKQLNGQVACDSEMCQMGDATFATSIEKENFMIEEIDQKDFRLSAQGRNLTESFFTQTVISLYDLKDEEIFSLELFWK